MVLSLLAYFLSMVTAFAVVMGALIGFGDSQLRSGRPSHYPAVSIVNTADRDAIAQAEKVKEAQKAAEAQRAADAKKAAEARDNAKKLARAKLARERKQAMVARLRQQRDNSLAFGYAAAPFSDTGGQFSFGPRFDR
jgi:hypothetical protein